MIVAAGVGLWWYLNRQSEKAAARSALPPLNVNESTLTPAGLKKLDEVRSEVKDLEQADTKRRFRRGLDIGDALREIGAYRSAADWYLKTIEWYEQLNHFQQWLARNKADAADCALKAGACYLFLGQTQRAIRTMERFARAHPDNPRSETLLGFCDYAGKDPAGFVQIIAELRASREYLK